MDGRAWLLQGVEPGMRGVEIGALCRPVVTQGWVIHVDHADTKALRQKYATDSGVDTDAIVNVGVVWGERPLSESISGADYIVASHVVEHVPDLIGWLRELRSILAPGGTIRLAVPDRRYTFDYLRTETVRAEVEYARGAKRPLPHIVYDFVSKAVELDAAKAWAEGVNPASLRRLHPPRLALDVTAAVEAGAYHDVHCWVFTPGSFRALMADLAPDVGLACAGFRDTQPGTIEFHAMLTPCDDARQAAASWL